MHIPLATESSLQSIEKRWGWQDPYFILESQKYDSIYAKELSKFVKSKDSNVCAIIAGHVHAASEGEFAPGRIQYIAAPLFDKYVRKIRVIPWEEMT